MSHRAYTKRNRPVTACQECHRRKQKCNRLKPCNICLARNVPEKCLYGDDSSKVSKVSRIDPQSVPLTPPSDDESVPEGTVDVPSDTFEDQFGYSALSDNAFLDLYKSINAIHVPTARALGLSTTPLPPTLKERYFKIIAQLPPKPICKTLIDIYFTEADWYFIALDRYFFDRLYAAWISSDLVTGNSSRFDEYPRDLQHFPALLLQVLAIGIQFSPADSEVRSLLNVTEYIECEKQSKLYSDWGCEIMSILGRQQPSISGVEHDIMRMAWLKNCSRGTESWQAIANAVSQAQDLELHLASDESQSKQEQLLTPQQMWYDEYRRRVWAKVFLLDSHMAFTLGRPRHIHLDDCTAEWPTNCDIPDDLTATKPREPLRGETPSSFTFVMFILDIAIKIHDIMSAKSKKAFLNDHRQVEAVHQQIVEKLQALPPAFRPSNPDTSWDQQKPHFPKLRQQILSTAYAFLMKLHRPYMDKNAASRTAVIQAALSTLDAQQQLFESLSTRPNQHRIYGFSFYTIDAALLLSAAILNDFPRDELLVIHTENSLQKALARLAILKSVSQVAASGQRLLTQCLAIIQARHAAFKGCSDPQPQPHVLSAEEAFLSADQLQFLSDYSLPNPQDFEMRDLV